MRFAIVVSKRIGKAYIRNKIKRRIREIIWKDDIRNKKLGIILIVRQGIVNLTFNELKNLILKDIRQYETSCHTHH